MIAAASVATMSPTPVSHPHPEHRPPSLPGAHPYPYTCRTSLDAPFWVQRSNVEWLLMTFFSRQPPRTGASFLIALGCLITRESLEFERKVFHESRENER